MSSNFIAATVEGFMETVNAPSVEDICADAIETFAAGSLSGKKSGKKDYAKLFIEQATKVHKGKYSYENFVYTGALIKGLITCPDHGNFEQTPHDHLKRAGCPKCVSTISKLGTLWLDILNIQVREHSIKMPSGKRYQVDGFDRKTNTVYEFNGDYWHGNPAIYNPADINKTVGKSYGQLHENTIKKQQDLIQAGYKVVSIWEADFKIQYKDQIPAYESSVPQEIIILNHYDKKIDPHPIKKYLTACFNFNYN